MQEAAAAMERNTVAEPIVYENSRAIPFVAAARHSGGELIASARIPTRDVTAAVEALETATAAGGRPCPDWCEGSHGRPSSPEPHLL